MRGILTASYCCMKMCLHEEGAVGAGVTVDAIFWTSLKEYTSYVGGVSSWWWCDRWYNILLIQYFALDVGVTVDTIFCFELTSSPPATHSRLSNKTFLRAHVTLPFPLSSLLIWQKTTPLSGYQSFEWATNNSISRSTCHPPFPLVFFVDLTK